MKKILSTALILLMILSVTVSASALSFTGASGRMTVSLPEGWEREDDIYAVDPFQAVFSSPDRNEELFVGEADLWAQLSESQRSGHQRSDISQETFTADDIDDMFGSLGNSNYESKQETVDGVEFWIIDFDTDIPYESITIPTHVKIALHINYGTMYVLRSNLYEGAKDANFYEILQNTQFLDVTPTNTKADRAKANVSRLVIRTVLLVAAFAVSGVVASEKKKKSTSPGSQPAVPTSAEAVSDGKQFVCNACGYRSTGWYQECPNCGKAGQMTKIS